MGGGAGKFVSIVETTFGRRAERQKGGKAERQKGGTAEWRKAIQRPQAAVKKKMLSVDCIYARVLWITKSFMGNEYR